VRRVEAAIGFSESQRENGLVIDVREPGEVSAKPVKGSVNIPRGVLEMKISELTKDADKAIYLHCGTGARATLAAEQLQRMGYTKVTAISSGIDEICRVQDG